MAASPGKQKPSNVNSTEKLDSDGLSASPSRKTGLKRRMSSNMRLQNMVFDLKKSPATSPKKNILGKLAANREVINFKRDVHMIIYKSCNFKLDDELKI